MRIISGWAKGKKLVAPPAHSNFIRPTSDRAREALFNILRNRVEDAQVLDLFAGTGAFGLEALSRGAKHVVFVDNNPKALAIIKKNIRICLQQTDRTDQHQQNKKVVGHAPSGKSSSSVTVLKRDLKKRLHLNKPCFDLIFIDPPYSKGLALRCLKNIMRSKVATANSLIIVEERSNEILPESLDDLTLTDQRRYGDTAFWFYRKLYHAAHLCTDTTDRIGRL